MSAAGFAPEFARNARIQLRPGRVLATIIICAVASLAAVAYHNSPVASSSLDLAEFIISVQIVVLVIGGGIYCLQSIHREKELNTFDYQRLTRLSPSELVLGKLLGPPVLTFLITLCLVPLALWAAFDADVTFSVVFEIYALLILGASVYGLLALLTSLLLGRGGSAGAILFYLAIVGMTSIDFSAGNSVVAVHKLSPFFAIELLPGRSSPALSTLPPLQDLFFGVTIPHVLALTAIDLTLGAWLLLALTRNIKRDPSVYEILSPAQAFAFVLYLNFLMLGFYRWVVPSFSFTPGRGNFVSYRPVLPAEAESTLLGLALWFFVIFGFSLLRNRERARRRISALGARAAGWWAALWPAPYLVSGALLVGFAVIAMIYKKLEPGGGWTADMGITEALFLALWLARDATYLQWMCLRRTRRPIVSAVLYLLVFYACTSTLITAFRVRESANAPYAAALIPSYVFSMNLPSWLDNQAAWLTALALLTMEILFFAWLQRKELQRFLATTPAQAEPSS